MKTARLVIALVSLLPVLARAELHVLVVEGLPGEDVYADQFAVQVESIQQAAATLTSAGRVHVLRTADASRDAVLAQLDTLRGEINNTDQLAVFLIGHGSYDDYEYKFNISGPDLTGEDLATSLDAINAASQLLINTSSSSGATADLLEADDRLLVLATKSGAQRHATRFGSYFAAALSDSAADINKNDIISVQEAFDFAERRVSDYFERANQLATEQPQIVGKRADRLSLARLGRQTPTIVDSQVAELVARRDALNAEIDELRLARDSMPIDEYQPLLLEKMLQLARVEDAIEAREQELDANE